VIKTNFRVIEIFVKYNNFIILNGWSKMEIRVF